MGNEARLGLTLGLIGLIGCKSGGGTATLDPNSGYAKLRPAIVKAVTAFPADPGTLPRCAPGLGRVTTVTLRSAAPALKVALARPEPGFRSENFRTYADGHQSALERGDFSKYNFSSFASATRFAVFSTTLATEPLMTNCVKVGNQNDVRYAGRSECRLTPGTVGGDLVVFDATGLPTCAVRLRVDGPVKVAGSLGVLGDMGNHVQQVVEGLFDVQSPSGGRWLAKLRADAAYKVTVEGAVVREPR